MSSLVHKDCEWAHRPVMLAEALEALAVRENGRYLDGTEGLGGHSEGILKKGGLVLGLDRDGAALDIARKRLGCFGDRARLCQKNFADFDDAMRAAGWTSLDGALLDVGLSSMQLDEADRGFSFREEGPLDMRMDRSNTGITAAAIVNRESYATLKNYIGLLGEDPQAGRIARYIVEARQKAPIETTSQLAGIVCRAYPAHWKGKSKRHPATRTFQALRMVVNEELGQLRGFLDKILPWLAPGGRLVIISFHSLEDRMVKHAMRDWARGCLCPRNLPVCECGHQPEVAILHKKPLTPGKSEILANPRAASAKLRAAEKMMDKADDNS